MKWHEKLRFTIIVSVACVVTSFSGEVSLDSQLKTKNVGPKKVRRVRKRTDGVSEGQWDHFRLFNHKSLIRKALIRWN